MRGVVLELNKASRLSPGQDATNLDLKQITPLEAAAPTLRAASTAAWNWCRRTSVEASRP